MNQEILNISDLDKYSSDFEQAINKALIASAYKVKDAAQQILIGKYPNSAKFKEGVYVGKLNNKHIAVSSLGTANDEDYKARFFVGGTKERKQTGGYRKTKEGIKYVQYQKPMSKGKIAPSDAVSMALNQERERIINFFNNLKL